MLRYLVGLSSEFLICVVEEGCVVGVAHRNFKNDAYFAVDDGRQAAAKREIDELGVLSVEHGDVPVVLFLVLDLGSIAEELFDVGLVI